MLFAGAKRPSIILFILILFLFLPSVKAQVGFLHRVANIEGSGKLFDVFNNWGALPEPYKQLTGNIVALSMAQNDTFIADMGGGIIIGEKCDHVLTVAHSTYYKGEPTPLLRVRRNVQGILTNNFEDFISINTREYRGLSEPKHPNGSPVNIGKDWAILRLNTPVSPENCIPTKILTDLDFSLRDGLAGPSWIVAGHIDPSRNNSENRMNFLGMAECSFYGTEGRGNRVERETEAVAHDCLATKGSSGYPIFLDIEGAPYLAAVHSADFLVENGQNNGSTQLRVDPYSPGLPLNLDFTPGNQWGAMNAATTIQDPNLVKTIRSLYPNHPEFIRSAHDVLN